jgi:uncharacterized C2H2 Zn-finger protein
MVQQCPICHKAFKTRGGYLSHIKRYSEEEWASNAGPPKRVRYTKKSHQPPVGVRQLSFQNQLETTQMELENSTRTNNHHQEHSPSPDQEAALFWNEDDDHGTPQPVHQQQLTTPNSGTHAAVAAITDSVLP